MQGKKKMVTNLANAITSIIKVEKTHGIDLNGICKVVIPRYANTNASAKYPTESKASLVPDLASLDKFG